MKISKPELLAIIDFMENEGFLVTNTTSIYCMHSKSLSLGGLEVSKYHSHEDKDCSITLFDNSIETSDKNISWLWRYFNKDNKDPKEDRVKELKEEFLRSGLSSIID